MPRTAPSPKTRPASPARAARESTKQHPAPRGGCGPPAAAPLQLLLIQTSSLRGSWAITMGLGPSLREPRPAGLRGLAETGQQAQRPQVSRRSHEQPPRHLHHPIRCHRTPGLGSRVGGGLSLDPQRATGRRGPWSGRPPPPPPPPPPGPLASEYRVVHHMPRALRAAPSAPRNRGCPRGHRRWVVTKYVKSWDRSTHAFQIL